MLILFLDFLQPHLKDGDLGPFRVLNFITVRAALSLGMAFLISLAIGPRVIEILRRLKAGQVIREAFSPHAIDLSKMHGGKAGTPTMGGLLIFAALLLPVLLFCRLTSIYVILLLLTTSGYGTLGFWDDYLKIHLKNHRGVSPMHKILFQAALGLMLGLTLFWADWPIHYAPTTADGYPYLTVPFFKFLYPHLGWLYIPFVMLVMLATSNAVNLTDGLDGLAVGVTASCTTAFLVVAYLASNVITAKYLYIPFVSGGGEMVVFLAALMGASMGFLWFNAHPAKVFMGDTGSMMLGGALGATAVLLKQEILLLVIGGVFVIEALSVILQVSCFKLTGTRIFRMSPLHHHFERAGVHESQIIIRFWLVSWLLALAGLAMLKLR